jgi:hypothetical protein
MRTDGANHGMVIGLPILRVPITKSFRRALGLARNDAVGVSLSSHSYAVGTSGNIATRVRTTRPDPEGDSVEELIIEGNAIKMTRTFSTHVITKDEL